jgi:hypothetical protein
LRSISNASPTGGIKPADNAAFGVQPQGYGVANRLAGKALTPPALPENASSVAVSWPVAAVPPFRFDRNGRSTPYFDAFFFTRTGIHFARKRHGEG